MKHTSSMILVAATALLACGCANPKSAECYEWKTGARADLFITASSKTMKLYLNPGEVLRGSYAIDPDAQFHFGTGVGISRSGVSGGVFPDLGFNEAKRIYALLSDEAGSGLMAEVVAEYSSVDGTGKGEVRTNDGRNYKLTFKK